MAIRTANNQSLTEITTLPSAVTTGSLVLLETQTASSDSTMSFTSGIDSTYDEYIFKFIDIHPGTDVRNFTFQVDTGTNTSYNQTMTTTQFNAQADEAGTSAALGYNNSGDQAQGSSFQSIMERCGNDNDSCVVGSLHLFNPSSTTFVKHFMVNCQAEQTAESRNFFTAGYVNTTTALTRVQFKMDSGNIDSGTIKLYGVA